MRHDGDNTLKYQEDRKGIMPLPRNPMECEKFFYDQQVKESRRELAVHIANGNGHEPPQPPQLELIDQARVLLSDILTTCGDPHSEASYRRLIATHSEELIRTALSETRQAHLEGRIVKTRGAYFTDTLKRLAQLRQ